MIEEILELYKKEFNDRPEITKIAGGGSPRKYFRLKKGDHSVIGVKGEDIRENENFIKLNLALEKNNIRVPHIIKVSEDKKNYLIQDLGDVSLYQKLQDSEKFILAQKALSELINIQTIPFESLSSALGYNPFSPRLIRWDLNYFKYDFLKPSGISFDEGELEDDFDRMVTELSDPKILSGFMYRDFQSRNIMIKDGDFWFIDFQGARKGPLCYDAVSFIWQAKAPFTYEEREMLGDYYIKELARKTGANESELKEQMELMKVFRTLQVLGAYGFRGIIERKVHFLESIPFGIKNLAYLNEKGSLDRYPAIKALLEPLQNKYNETGTDKKGLTVKVISFSFKKGYPEDNSGNGGGFMFDCRAIHNPGRYEEYKSLTGKDIEVKEFLEKTNEAGEFVERSIEIVRPSIERYLKRGFTSLQVGFGCTGGQHRSVYCAEKFSKKIKEIFPEVKVELFHREQDIN